MNDTEYHKRADSAFRHIEHALERADEEGAVEMEIDGSMVTITLDSGKQFIISKHAPTKQLWLSSPVSGGLHFSYDESKAEWMLSDHRVLMPLLMTELKQAGVTL